MTAAARHFGTKIARWSIWNEPNQPQFLLPQYSAAKHTPLSPRIYRNLFLAGQRGLARRRPAERAGAHRRDLAARHGQGRGAAHVPARHVLPGLEVPQGGQLRRAARRRLRPPRLHDGVGAAVQAQAAQRRDDRRHRPARHGARPGRERRARSPSKLPIHLTEFGIQSTPDRDPGRQPRPGSPTTARSPSASPTRPAARRRLLAVPAARRPAEPERDPPIDNVPGLRVGPAHERRQGQARADRLPPAARGAAPRLAGVAVGARARPRPARRPRRSSTRRAARSRSCSRRRPTRAATSRGNTTFRTRPALPADVDAARRPDDPRHDDDASTRGNAAPPAARRR